MHIHVILFAPNIGHTSIYERDIAAGFLQIKHLFNFLHTFVIDPFLFSGIWNCNFVRIKNSSQNTEEKKIQFYAASNATWIAKGERFIMNSSWISSAKSLH